MFYCLYSSRYGVPNYRSPTAYGKFTIVSSCILPKQTSRSSRVISMSICNFNKIVYAKVFQPKQPSHSHTLPVLRKRKFDPISDDLRNQLHVTSNPSKNPVQTLCSCLQGPTW